MRDNNFRPDFFTVVKCENEIRPAFPRENPM